MQVPTHSPCWALRFSLHFPVFSFCPHSQRAPSPLLRGVPFPCFQRWLLCVTMPHSGHQSAAEPWPSQPWEKGGVRKPGHLGYPFSRCYGRTCLTSTSGGGGCMASLPTRALLLQRLAQGAHLLHPKFYQDTECLRVLPRSELVETALALGCP